MKRSSTALAALAVALVTALGAGAGNGTPINNGSANRLDLAVIGDLPYNAAGFTDILARIEARSAAFDGPVLLLQGDSHQFVADKPFAGARTSQGSSSRARRPGTSGSSSPSTRARVRSSPGSASRSSRTSVAGGLAAAGHTRSSTGVSSRSRTRTSSERTPTRSP